MKVLPTVICFQDGLVVDRIVGFEELGSTDAFKTATLERRLIKSGVVQVTSTYEPEDALCGYGAKEEYDSDE